MAVLNFFPSSTIAATTATLLGNLCQYNTLSIMYQWNTSFRPFSAQGHLLAHFVVCALESNILPKCVLLSCVISFASPWFHPGPSKCCTFGGQDRSHLYSNKQNFVSSVFFHLDKYAGTAFAYWYSIHDILGERYFVSYWDNLLIDTWQVGVQSYSLSPFQHYSILTHLEYHGHIGETGPNEPNAQSNDQTCHVSRRSPCWYQPSIGIGIPC